MMNLASKKTVNLPFNKMVLADENLRSGDKADEQIPQLADSLVTADGKSIQLLPIFVKQKDDGTYAVLDGRRRWMAYALLIDQGRINDAFKIQSIVCETEAEIAQAVILANTERLNPSDGDELLTLNKLISEKFAIADMARALGRAEKDIRQKLVLARLDPAFLTAYKSKRLSLRVLRCLARLKDADRLDQIKTKVLNGGYVYDHEVTSHDDGMTDAHSVFKVISVESYLAAGGLIENDLLEELPGKILNPEIAFKLFEEALTPAKEFMTSVGIEGFIFGSPDYSIYQRKPWNVKTSATDEMLAELHKSLFGVSEDEAEAEADEDGYDDYDGDYDEDEDGGQMNAPAPAPAQVEDIRTPQEVIDQCNVKLINMIKYELANVAPLQIRLVTFETGRLSVDWFFLKDEVSALQQAQREAEGEEEYGAAAEGGRSSYTPAPRVPPVDTKGFSNAHHERTTRMAGQALALTLRTSPLHALGLQIATQLRKATRDLRSYSSCDGGVLTLQANMAITGGANEDQELSSELLKDFQTWKDRFIESGKTHFGFAMELPLTEMLDLLSVLTALQIDTSEIKTDYQKHSVRAEAVELAEALGHRFEDVMIPGLTYFKGFKKPILLSFIRDMGLDTKGYEALKTGPLQEAVVELAKEHRFVPRHLNPMVGVVAAPADAIIQADATGHAETSSDQELSATSVTEPSEDIEIAA